MPPGVTQELRDMFWDLKGATLSPRFLRILQRAETMVLFPEWEVIPRTTMNRVIRSSGGGKLICLVEGGVWWGKNRSTNDLINV